MKIIAGNFHQANEKFGETAGLQCGINCITAACFTLIKKISSWNEVDLDFILDNGNTCFRNLGHSEYLALDQLPDVIRIEDYEFNMVKFDTLKTVELTLGNYNSKRVFGDKFIDCLKESQAVVFVTSDVMFMVRKESTQYYLFDPHSRSKINGEPIENGFSVLLKFKNMSELTNYIRYIYLLKRERESCYIQMQFFNCVAIDSDIGLFRKSLKCKQANARRKKYYETKKDELKRKYRDLIGSPEHIKLKEAMHEQYENVKDDLKEKYMEFIGSPEHIMLKDTMHERYENVKDDLKEKYMELIGSPEHIMLK